MRTRSLLAVAASLCAQAFLPASGLAQDPPHLPRFGLAAGASTLGVSIQAATAVTRHSNLRVAFNDFSYSTTFKQDGIAYSGKLALRSAEILYDQYLRGPIHISAGALIYDGNHGTGSASVPGGQSFSLGGTTYYSQAGNPITGTGAISASKVAPVVLIGIGNLLPRSRRHLSVNVDLGVVFQGSPNATLNLSGGACTGLGSGCRDVGGDSGVRGNLMVEQDNINNSLAPFRYYPVVSVTVGYKF